MNISQKCYILLKNVNMCAINAGICCIIASNIRTFPASLFPYIVEPSSRRALMIWKFIVLSDLFGRVYRLRILRGFPKKSSRKLNNMKLSYKKPNLVSYRKFTRARIKSSLIMGPRKSLILDVVKLSQVLNYLSCVAIMEILLKYWQINGANGPKNVVKIRFHLLNLRMWCR